METALPESLSAKKAHAHVQENPRALLIDVRSSMEFLFVGHPDLRRLLTDYGL